METKTTVSNYNVTRNIIIGRLSKCTDYAELRKQLEVELSRITPARKMKKAEMDAMIGIDRGIKAAASGSTIED